MLLQAKNECFCGDKLTMSNKVKNGECMDPCKGDREQACGGGWRLAVYQNPKYKPSKSPKHEIQPTALIPYIKFSFIYNCAFFSFLLAAIVKKGMPTTSTIKMNNNDNE